MNKTTNNLKNIYEELKKELKNRGKVLSKDEFFNAVAKTITPEEKAKLLNDFTPKTWFINEKLKNDPSFLERVSEML